tara:strand:+ start:643 stop:915 length:273 start_codon:yes stop_codon:yes gene_type:complete
MNLQDAQFYIINLHHKGWLYHLDDDAVDCLRDVATVKQAQTIQDNIDLIIDADFDWGMFGCPLGFCVALHNNELDLLIESHEIPQTLKEE